MRIQIKWLLAILIIPLLLIAFWTYSSNSANAQPTATKTCVCHVEDKKTNDGHVIEVDENSLGGHLAHGDTQCTDCANVGNACNTGSGPACSSTSLQFH